jgi:hypothetical protein
MKGQKGMGYGVVGNGRDNSFVVCNMEVRILSGAVYSLLRSSRTLVRLGFRPKVPFSLFGARERPFIVITIHMSLSLAPRLCQLARHPNFVPAHYVRGIDSYYRPHLFMFLIHSLSAAAESK